MMKKIFKDGISIVVCCYNSASRLPQTLRHIASQNVPNHISWEVVIVNNNSTDNTIEVARREWEKYTTHANNFEIVDQPIPGLSAARKKGVESSIYNYIVFCDDDNWLKENYISKVYEILSNKHEVGAIGGWSEAVFDCSPPEWFNRLSFSCAVGKIKEQDGYSKFVWGAGLGLKREAYEKLISVDFKSLLTDRMGKELSSGGDEELCLALQIAGYKIYFTQELFFYHYMPQERHNWVYFKKLYLGLGKAKASLFPYNFILDNIPTNKNYLWLRVLKDVLKDLFINLHWLFFFWQQGNYKVLQLYGNIGLVKSILLQNKNFDRNISRIIQMKGKVNN